MTGQRAAEILFNCATILEMHNANPFRVGAYRNAGRMVMALGENAERVIMDDDLLAKSGFGKSLGRKLRELFTTNEMGFYEGLLATLPDEVERLMKMPGVGPHLAMRLYRELGIRSLRQLAEAAREGKVSKLRGFGPKREARYASWPNIEVVPTDVTPASIPPANVTPIRRQLALPLVTAEEQAALPEAA